LPDAFSNATQIIVQRERVVKRGCPKTCRYIEWKGSGLWSRRQLKGNRKRTQKALAKKGLFASISENS
jgi:hypothetical protein